MVNDSADPQKVSLSWTPIGTPSSYVVRYGQSKDNMSAEIKTTSPSTVISQLELGKEYFFQVFALDANGVVSGQGSSIVSQVMK